MTIGEKLKEARHKKGLSLKEIQAELKIRTAYLEAMENDRFEDIPGETYRRAFLRTYASYLGLDADEIVEEYNTIYGVPEYYAETRSGETPTGKAGKIFSTLLIILIFGAAIYLLLPLKKPQPELPQAPLESTINPEKTAERPQETTGKVEPRPESSEFALKIEIISEKSWIEVKETKTGKVLAAKIFTANESFETTASSTLTVVIGYPKAVKIYYNGQEFTDFPKQGVVKLEAGGKEIKVK
jgi:cytoskeletal protein RodZ